MKKFAIILATILTVAIFMTNTTCYADNGDAKKEPKLNKTQNLKIGNDTINIREYDDNGRKVMVYSGNVKDKSVIEPIIENSSYSSPIMTIDNYEGWAPERNYYVSGIAPENSSAKVNESIYCQAYSMPFNFKLNTWGGYTAGYWNATSPVNANKIILRQRYSVVALGATVSWPVSFGNVAGNDYEWVSSEFFDCWNCTAPHETINISGATAGMGISVSDGSDIYLGTTCYKSRCEVTKDWHAVYYN